MSDYSFDSPYDIFNFVDYAKPHNEEAGLYSNAGDDVQAPSLDEFDADLDAALTGTATDNIDLSNLVGLNPPIQLPGFDSYRPGPPSTFTFSSESSYDSPSTLSESSYSESIYGYSPHEVEVQNFQKTLDELDSLALQGCIDPAPLKSASSLSPPAYAPPIAGLFGLQSSLSDYGPTTGNYFNQLESYGTMANANASTEQLGSQIALRPYTDDTRRENSRKKYKCTICTRAFDRAFNLKTHMETHDPHRKKPHKCQVCGRSFSRKHDLGRHVTSLHKETNALTRSVGVGEGTRTWCDNCGKSSVGNCGACKCIQADEVK
ncbi:hypothetical protein C8R42DRAFT_651803 [Lentinula raphanica]|nr:hypothetical protein C8R42DRAFT_651803 [Lentinula raphanica]